MRSGQSSISMSVAAHSPSATSTVQRKYHSLHPWMRTRLFCVWPFVAAAGTSHESTISPSSSGPRLSDAGATETALFVGSAVTFLAWIPQFTTWSRMTAFDPAHVFVWTSPPGGGLQHGGGGSRRDP